MSNKKTSALLVTVGTAIALTAGGALAYWLFQRQSIAGEGDSLKTLSMVPQSALVTVSLSTSPDQWQQVRSFGTVETQTKFNQQLALWRDRLLTDNGLNYREDIQPWVGDKIIVVVFPPDVAAVSPDPSQPDAPNEGEAPGNDPTGESNAEQNNGTDQPDAPKDEATIDPELINPTQSQPPVLLLPIADPLKARSTLKDALGDAGEPVKRDYNGVEIQELSPQGDQPYFAAVLDRKMLALTTDDSLLEQVIDTSKGGDSVLDIPGYNRAVGQLSSGSSFIDLYVNSSAAATLAAANTVQAKPPQGLDALQDGQGIVSRVVIGEDSLTFNGVTWLKEEAENPYQPGKPVKAILAKLPQNTLVMAAGSNFKQLWDTVDRRASEGIKGPLNPQNMRSGFQSLTGLDMDRDLVDWMTGGFALALVTAPETAEASPTVGLVMMAEAGDRPTAEKTFSTLDGVMRDRYKFQVTPKTVGDIQVTDWAAPFASLVVTRGWLEDDTVLITLGNIVDSIIPKPSTSLGNDPLFQQVTAGEDTTANGYFFVNLEAIVSGKSSLPIPPLPPDQASTVKAIRAIGLTTDIQDERTAKFNLTVLMPKLEDPGTLPESSSESPSEPSQSPEGEPETPE